MRPEHFLFAAVPVVSGRRPPAGRGPVRRDQQEPGRGETLRCMRSRVHAEIQPGQILPKLRGADAPEERGRTAAAKIPVFGRPEMNTHEKAHADKICQRSAPVWLMSVLQIRRTIPYNARKAVAEVRKTQAGKEVTEREDMEKAFPPVLSNLNLVVVAGYGPVEYAFYLRI